MHTVDAIRVRAPAPRLFGLAADVERWPTLLPHYRWVRVLDRGPDHDRVEMAAWRPFGPFNWPTWWTSDMWIDRAALEVRYRHILGVTRGMDVVWHLEPRGDQTEVTLTHDWEGPAWPLIRRPAAEWVIGPVFVHGIASRTLAGLARAAEAAAAAETGDG